jgi:hypothetical protein
MSATEDDDLRVLLHAPALALDPPAALADRVRISAAPVRRR